MKVEPNLEMISDMSDIELVFFRAELRRTRPEDKKWYDATEKDVHDVWNVFFDYSIECWDVQSWCELDDAAEKELKKRAKMLSYRPAIK